MDIGSSSAAFGAWGRVRVTRSAAYRDLIRPYQLYADGHRVGEVRARQSVDIPLPVGRRSLEARIDWCRSKVVQVDVLEQECVDLTVGTGNFLAIVPPARGYIRLRRGTPSSELAPAIVRLLIGAVLLVAAVAGLLHGWSGDALTGARGLPLLLMVVVGALGAVTVVDGIIRLLTVRFGQSGA
ncbi:hypothetical protein SAMN04488544_2481 [Microlunatus sagamiharensis]|uniref:Uncharacterized protein n=1 Tax=Microlunatus sagamiharensis TaxID=546874 RepID=A0A1H2MPM4_9ACTN|nr:hypothetical protein [Microlunatus sagamiharensis]SDU95200.1 hypothetical protein SAMN04488544_2481 [Microlunatus sagamiharensis]